MDVEAGPATAAQERPTARARRAGPVVVAAGAALVGVAAFLPWIRTGHRSRNSFQMMRAADLLDLVSGPARVALRAWYLVPVLVALVWVAAALDWHRVMVGLAVGLALATALAAWAVLSSGIPTGAGPRLALVASGGIVAGTVLTIRPSRRPT